jgi:GTP-binding protein Era
VSTANEPIQQSGFVAVMGRPNVGKSSLCNHIVGRKVSITSQKPQTTRHQITGIKTNEQAQMVFVDTPGLSQQAPNYALQRYMDSMARHALRDVDVVLFVIEATQFNDEDRAVLEQVQQAHCPIVLAINKVDVIKDKSRLLPFIETINNYTRFEEIIPVSAEDSTNIDVLEKALSQYLPEQEFYFPPSMTTVTSDQFLASEVVREKLMRVLGQEVPYALTVETEDFVIKNDVLHIHALIWVEKPGQKRIVIGRKGAMLRKIGQKARHSMEALFGHRIYLELWVKVKRGWSDDEKALQRFGYNTE